MEQPPQHHTAKINTWIPLPPIYSILIPFAYCFILNNAKQYFTENQQIHVQKEHFK